MKLPDLTLSECRVIWKNVKFCEANNLGGADFATSIYLSRLEKVISRVEEVNHWVSYWAQEVVNDYAASPYSIVPAEHDAAQKVLEYFPYEQ